MTRAVRDAMAASVALLALSAGPVAHAAAREHALVADAAALDRMASTTAPGVAPVDLTRVDADEHPASVRAFPALRGVASAADLEAFTQIDNHDDRHASGDGIVQALYAMDDVVRIDNHADITADAFPPDAGGYAAAIGVRAGGGDVEVHNLDGGLIGATAGSDGGRARARAIYASGYAGIVSVSNEGDIQAEANAGGGRAESHGIYAFGYGSANDIRNDGDIHASARSDGGFGYATGITAIGYGSGDNVSAVANSGSIHVEADAAYAYAFGAFNLTRQRDGSAYLANDGEILAEANGNLATATGAFNLALRYGDAAMVNAGDIEAIADGTQGGVATGIYSYANVQDVSVDNSGLVQAAGSGDKAIATGIHASSSLYGATGVVNDGDVVAHAYGNAGFAHAAGIVAESETTVDATNNEDIDVLASTVDGAALAIGMYAAATQAATLRNYGDVSVSAASVHGDAAAYGMFEYVGGAGIGLAINGGDIQVAATGGAGARADATGINVVGDVASVFNDGSVGVVATAGEGGLADARAARAYGAYTTVANYGSLSATADARGGDATSRGADSLGFLGSSVYNAGDIQASAIADGGSATAFGSYSMGENYSGYTANIGSISAHASGDSARAYGALTASMYYGNAITANAGDISAIAEGGIAEYGETEAIAIGVYSSALIYDAVVDNDGSISAAATALADIGGTDGFLQAKAVGAQAMSLYGYGDAVIANAGTIAATALASQGYASAWGAAVQSSGQFGGASTIDNDGAISAYAHADIGMATATGAYTLDLVGASGIVNHGDIVAHARSERGITGVSVNFSVAYGAKARSYYGNADLDNDGNIEADASVVGGIAYSYGAVVSSGGYASVYNAAGASIVANVETELFGGAFANAVTVGGMYGVDVVNDGDINAYAIAHGYTDGTSGFYGGSGATGIYAAGSFTGDATVVNNGVVNAISIAENAPSVLQGGAAAVGIDAYGNAVTVANTGDVNAIGRAEFGFVGSSGINAHGKYSNDISNAAGASIYAYASAGNMPGDPEPASAVAWGTQTWGSDSASTYNAGSIVAHAIATADEAAAHGGIASAYGSTVGRYSGIDASGLVNHGDIEAAAEADFGYATAYGAYVHGEYQATLANAGGIRSSATASEGNAFAVGAHAYSLHETVTYVCDYYSCDWDHPTIVLDGGEARIDNHGDIAALAQASGGEGYSYGASSIGAFSAAIDNAGSIVAGTNADIAKATGALVRSANGDASLANSGDIVANATGDTSADATGAWVQGLYGASVDNAGRILAGAYGAGATATALRMGDTGANTLVNDGTIAAFGDGTRIAIRSGADASADITNNGSLVGAIVTGDLGDRLDNAAGGSWQAVGTSDFGAGDDAIANHGTIFMDDAILRMGDAFAASGGNAFDNFGALAVSGAGNLVDMGAGNPSPFASNGTISFIDGAPDDVLTIVGDFAGEGAIDLDVSGLNQSADRLYVDGNAIDSSVQALNVNLVDMPTQSSSEIALVTVEGNATAGNFVLGNVAHAAGFLDWTFRLDPRIDSDGSRDVFSLGIDATGLNDAGVLAANVASGAAGMLDAQVGTFRQRMGVNPHGDPAKVLGAFFRAWSDQGDVEPTHVADDFAQGGDFAYDQHATGEEVGIDAAFSANFHAGLVLGDADGRQRLANGASGRMDGTTWGAYATWFAPKGFYLDLSGRWMSVDVASTSSDGQVHGRAHANAWNLEAGYEWKRGRLSIVPQLQFTRTEVDDARSIQADGTLFESQGASSRLRLGVEIATTFAPGKLRWTPYASFNAIRESDGDFGYVAHGAFTGTTFTAGTSAMAELGLGVQAGDWSLTLGAHWTDGGAYSRMFGGQALLRFAW